ncbi:MAG: ABC transporter permease [Planctomycetota bacterium]|nr:MAG: ABC transporter permease [Planctomycetota bacterium]
MINKTRLSEWGGLVLVWLAIVALFGLLAEHFLSAATFTTLAGRLPALAVIAAGMTLVVVSGGIDLSVGSVMALCGAVLGLAVTQWKWPLLAAVPLAILTGAAAGLTNGLLTAGLRIPSFLVTLGLLEVCRGLSYAVSGSRTLFIGAGIEPLARPLPFLGVPATVPAALLVVVTAQILLSKTVFGRHLVAIGTNENAVRLAGIDTRRAKVTVFLLSGALAGVAAVFAVARLGSADPNAGTGLELAAIAAVVIGGTSLAGGTGSVIGSLLGVLVIATLEAGLAQLGASEPLKRMVTGGVIIAAVAADGLRRRLSADRD